jgi:hypothetical protein
MITSPYVMQITYPSGSKIGLFIIGKVVCKEVYIVAVVFQIAPAALAALVAPVFWRLRPRWGG